MFPELGVLDSGLWFTVSGFLFPVYGVKFLVSSFRVLDSEFWFLVSGVWFLSPEARGTPSRQLGEPSGAVAGKGL